MNEMEQRVWQRVMGQPQSENSELKKLAMDSQEGVTLYRQLLKSRVESHRELGRKLLSTEGEILNSLKGLHYLQAGVQMKLPMTGSTSVDVKSLVRRYHIACRAVAEFTARSAEPEWGCVFLNLAKLQERQCQTLCQLLGHMK